MESMTTTINSSAFFLSASRSSSNYLLAQEATGAGVSYVSGSSGENTLTETVQSGDQVSLSPEALAQAGRPTQTENEYSDNAVREKRQQGEDPAEQQSRSLLNGEEQQQVAELEARDREVRTHEQAHLSAAGQHAAGGIQYTYQNGPDGKQYAVGGEVPIDVSEESTPEATIEKMQIVRKAALAPASPSAADRQIAATATQKETAARVEMQAEKQTDTPAPPAESDVPEEGATISSSAPGTEIQEGRSAEEYTSFTALA